MRNIHMRRAAESVRRGCLLLLCLSLLLLTGCRSLPEAGPSESRTEEKEVPSSVADRDVLNLVLSISGSEKSVDYHWAAAYRDRVLSLSGGRILIDVYPEGVLGGELEVAEDCRYGTVDIQITSTAAVASIVPEAALFDMPFIYTDLVQLRQALQREEIREYMGEAYEKRGFHLLSLADQGFRELSSSRRITSVEDLRGMVICCRDNDSHRILWESLGMSTEVLDVKDVYLALQKDVTDGQENPYEQILNRNFYEVQKYVTNSNHLPYVGAMHISSLSWNHLKQNERRILSEAAAEVEQELASYVDGVQSEALQDLQRWGIKLIDLDQIDGFREFCIDRATGNVRNYILGCVDQNILDIWCEMALSKTDTRIAN